MNHQFQEMDVRRDQRIGDVYARIIAEAQNQAEKGYWFEHLFMEVARTIPDFQVEEIWRWRDWPQRVERTGLDGRDMGIDLVARLSDKSVVAIQCKCFSDNHKVAKRDIDSFINESSRDAFGLRWIVATSEWNEAAETTILDRNPPIFRIDFLKFLDFSILEVSKPVTPRMPKPLQERAIDGVVDGLNVQGLDRGKLLMACGTGKTFTALRASERLVPDNGSILFAAPTISLVSQARREWLTHSIRPMSALVVCSDATAGGKGEQREFGPDDLVCPVISDPDEIGRHLSNPPGVKAVFCTYHSLHRVIDAQRSAGGGYSISQ